jgi:outer membrane protein OmpA-like peptidoglycan-associated protein
MNRTRIFFLLLVFNGLLNAAFAQKDLKKLGDTYFDNKKYAKALETYLAHEQTKPKEIDYNLRYRIGLSAYHAGQLPKAKKYLDFVAESGKVNEENLVLFVAQTYHALMEFDIAAKNYKLYLNKVGDNPARRRVIKDQIRRCATGKRLLNQEKIAYTENLGINVNSEGDDFAPVLSPNHEDRLYFSSLREGNVGGARDAKGLKDDKFGSFSSDMFYTEVANGEWSAPTPLDNLINSPRNEVLLDFSADGKRLYFFKGLNTYSGDILQNIFTTDVGALDYPRFQSSVKAENGDNSLSFVNDSTILFASNRAGGFGGFDIYISLLKKGTWTDPENLGSDINTPHDEVAPFLAKDGRTLYFSSNNTDGIGGLDVFKSKFNEIKKYWSPPQNLGIPINSSEDDTNFRLDAQGLKGFFTSARKEGQGGRDIYSAYFKIPLKEQTIAGLPPVFHLIAAATFEKLSKQGTATNNAVIVEECNVPILYYDNDEDLLSSENKNKLQPIIALLKAHPELQIQLTCHTEATNTAEFDLYFGIKRAEKLGTFLIEKGIQPQNIYLLSAGASYPVAKTAYNGIPNPVAQRLNRRVKCTIFNPNNLPLRFNHETTAIDPNIAMPLGDFYEKTTASLSYKIQIATVRQMYKGDIIANASDATIESAAGTGMYLYTAGIFKDFKQADQYKANLQTQGARDLQIVAYLNGQKIMPADLKKYIATYPDLNNMLKK